MKTIALLLVLSVTPLTAQKLVTPVVANYRVSDVDLINIVKAEDARDASPVIAMLTNVNTAIRYRAALAVGRIGDDKAIDGLIALLKDDSIDVRSMAAFAIGEIESAKGSDAIVKLLDDPKTPDAVLARAVEAAGKIATANPRDPRSKDLGDAVLDVLDAEIGKGEKYFRDTVVFGITAVLRARPNEGDLVTAKFLGSKDARIRADAANTLTRLRSKNANPALRSMLSGDKDAVARANAARALGAADDKGSLELMLNAATKDTDSRVRVSAIRSLATFNDKSVVDKLLSRGDELLEIFQKAAKPKYIPSEKTELIEIATALRGLAANTGNEKAVGFLHGLRKADRFTSGETEMALASVAPSLYVEEFKAENNGYSDWRVASSYAQGLGSLASSTDANIRAKAAQRLREFIAGMSDGVKPAYSGEILKAMPALQRANAAFKPDNLGELMRNALGSTDVNIRADAAGIISNQPPTKENIEALKKAFDLAFVKDKTSDDAILSIMGALYRLDKKGSVGTFLVALDSPNYLVRKRAFEMLADRELQAASPGVLTSLENARAKHKDQVLPYSSAFGTKLGQMLNSDADYRRALSRKNGSVKAVITTQKGRFTIDFLAEDAPLTVDNFVKLARSGYFNGAEVHRVVANFVMQDGDPTGTGSGGPGFSIRCEVNMKEYDRGAVGMALSGKDTGGSQWFATHSPQPHLDGGYTVFGHVSERDMKVVDNIVRGDKILTVRILGR